MAPDAALRNGPVPQLPRVTIEDRRFKGLPPSPAPRSRPSTPPAPYAGPTRAHQHQTPSPR